MTAQLFTPVELGGVTLPNRIIVSPMCQYSAVDGSAQPWHQVHYGMLAMSGAGLLCLEATHVEREGRITQGCLGLYSDENEAALKPVIDWIRGWMPGVKLGVQLAHAGRKASAQRPWKGGGPLTQADAPDLPWTTYGPSALAYDPEKNWHTPVALDSVSLKRVKQAFVEAAERSLRLGFDVVELHGAHGYLLSQFLSPLSNQRTDEYGGSAEKRRRFPLEVFEAVRRMWPTDKALGMRLSAVEWVEGGVTIEDTVETARQLKALGCDFVDVSSGGNAPGQKITLGPGYHVPFAARVRKEAGIKTWAVGLITEPEQAEKIIASGEADCTAHARPFLLDPRWAWNAARTLGVETPPLPLPAARATTILPFKPRPSMAKAAE
ncbi:NADH:flavin oxidoreductase/NADH oxidase [Reyranella aquatilis]|jgi:2,4-dienoyl-CoA reductase-like NADH-dependent reductase (Old Yellow Enzyme family)|uniref:NADH:flavin oxidoreductase/NADH oxidase n=1 Tax=Reyranella aquatilis TaxID=2035356 RepID=A0ABS8KQB4_9HYPH|nr:NADH:flavin oxidoreductase/NADH oxidase [Reyranella aquatilis]MCC8428245.1 NADH:flavin oxidoreductase/NADH oxidase [Reyranella aquatilis]